METSQKVRQNRNMKRKQEFLAEYTDTYKLYTQSKSVWHVLTILNRVLI
jgi:hypothetical protein